MSAGDTQHPWEALPVFDIPDGLPSGRFLPDDSPTMWQSDFPVADPVGLWEYCDRGAAATGVWPVLSGSGLYHRISPWPPHDPARVEDASLEQELRARWEALRARQAEGPPSRDFFPDDDMYASVVEEWPQQWPPYGQWPGLAPAEPDSVHDATEVHRRVLAEIADDPAAEMHRRQMEEVFGDRARLAPLGPCLALVLAKRPADIPAVMAWDAEAPLELLSAMLRSWEDRFGARVVAFEGATLHVAVARPPVTAANASLVAFEHVLLGDDNHKGELHFADYASSLIGDRHWRFWWD